MKIKIAHLYYDILNLYGENGNVRALKKHFEDNGIKTEISFLTINDKIDFNKYDIYYMGMGSELSERLVIKDIIKYKKEIKKAIENNKYFIVTGNSYEIFGKYITDFDDVKLETLGIFDYYTKVIKTTEYTNQNNFRIASECSGYTKFLKKKVIGFQNRAGFIYDNKYPLFKMNYGAGDNPKTKTEGIHYKNFYGTYFIGPLLIRNPYLTDYLVKKIAKEKDKNFKLKKIEDARYLAYNEYIKNFPNM